MNITQPYLHPMNRFFLMVGISLFSLPYLVAQQPELVLPVIHGVPVEDMIDAKNGDFFVSCSHRSIKLWNATTGQLIRTIPWRKAAAEGDLATDTGFKHIDISANGSLLMTGSDCGENFESASPQDPTKIQLWNSRTGQLIKDLISFTTPTCINRVEISSDGQLALAVYGGSFYSPDGFSRMTTKVWDIKSGKEIMVREGEWGKFAADKKHIITRTAEKVNWINLSIGKVEAAAPIDKSTHSLGSTSDGTYLFTANNTQLVVWNVEKKKRVAIHQLVPTGAYNQSKSFFSSDGQYFTMTEKIGSTDSLLLTQYNTLSGKQMSRYQKSLSSQIGFVGEVSKDGRTYFYAPMIDLGDNRAAIHAIHTLDGNRKFSFGLAALEANDFNYSENEKVLTDGHTFYVSIKTHMGYFLFNANDKSNVQVDEIDLPATFQESKDWGIASKQGNTITLFRKNDSVEVATILPFGENDWVVATPAGLFDGSAKGREALHYADGLETIGLEQFEERYYEPSVLDKILAGREAEIRDVTGLSVVNMYPKVVGELKNKHLQLQLEERSGGIGKLSFFINGIEVEEDINRGRKKNLSINLDTYKRYFYTDRPNQIGLVAYNQEGWFKSRQYVWTYNPSGIVVSSRGNIGNSPRASSRSDFDHRRAKLYALVVGTSKYRGEALNLTYADKDALAMAEALDIATKNLFTKGRRIEVLTTEAKAASQKPTKENIRGILAEFAKEATPYDVVILYFAGHGISLGQDEKVQFYYLTQDVLANPTAKDTAVLQQSTISSNELTTWQSAITAPKKVMILDACQSGQLLNDISKERSLTNARRGRALDRMKNRSGMFILSGSAADQSSLEASPFGHGLLTYSLLQGMSLVASRDADKLLNVQELFQHSKDQVEKMAKRIGREQVPEMIGLKDAADYAIGLLENPNLIKVPTVKPMVAKPKFMDKQRFSDVWGIEEKLQARFVKISERGSNPPYIFVNSQAIGEAYSVQGFTASTNQPGQLKIEGALLKGDKVVQAFAESGKTDEIDDIVQRIIDEIELLIE